MLSARSPLGPPLHPYHRHAPLNAGAVAESPRIYRESHKQQSSPNITQRSQKRNPVGVDNARSMYCLLWQRGARECVVSHFVTFCTVHTRHGPPRMPPRRVAGGFVEVETSVLGSWSTPPGRETKSGRKRHFLSPPIQTAYHADAADIRPRRPLLAVPTLHITGGGYSQKRPSNSVVGIFEVVRKSAFFATHASVAFCMPFDEAKLTPDVLPAGGSRSAAVHWSLLVVATRASHWRRPLLHG